MAIKCFRVSVFIIVVLMIIPQRVNCLSCYNCTSTTSWKDCNSKMTETECPWTFTNCVKIKLTCLYLFKPNITFFYKRCGNQNCQAATNDTPFCPSGSISTSDVYCCNCNNCNSVSFHKLSSALTGVSIVMVLWGLHTFVY